MLAVSSLPAESFCFFSFLLFFMISSLLHVSRDNCKAITSDSATYDPLIAKKLWEVSEELVMPKLKV